MNHPANSPTDGLEEAAMDQPVRTRSIASLMWRKFCRNKLALLSLWVLIAMYGAALAADFLSPANPQMRHPELRFSPPTKVRIIHDGSLSWPFIYAWEKPFTDLKTYKRAYVENTSRRVPIRMFVQGDPYKLFGLFPSTIHLWGTGDAEAPVFLLGADRFGRDLLSRILKGSQASLSVGLIGVALSILIGASLGVVCGYFGGWADLLIQRLIEIIHAIPTLPLWLALAAVVPATWSSVTTYFMITVILSLIGWTGMARTVRGLTLRLQQSDLAMAARCIGASDRRMLFKHMLPYSYSIIIVGASLSIPGTIIGETSLSFLGLGIRAPMVSWGVLLADAQNVSNLALYPWLLWPAACVVLTVLAFNFLGDGVRDATDPFTY